MANTATRNGARAAEGLPRRCACGCGNPVTSTRRNARYATDACRAKAWKARTGYRDPRRAKPSRNGNRAPRRAPDLRVSYRKLIAHLENEFISLGFDAPHTKARALARALLTKRQRAAARELGL